MDDPQLALAFVSQRKFSIIQQDQHLVNMSQITLYTVEQISKGFAQAGLGGFLLFRLTQIPFEGLLSVGAWLDCQPIACQLPMLTNDALGLHPSFFRNSTNRVGENSCMGR